MQGVNTVRYVVVRSVRKGRGGEGEGLRAASSILPRMPPFPWVSPAHAPPFRVFGLFSAVCGNQLCEYGEECMDSACIGGDQCSADCPSPLKQCPLGGVVPAVCSGHGLCVGATGTCNCFQGYGAPHALPCLPACLPTVAMPATKAVCP